MRHSSHLRAEAAFPTARSAQLNWALETESLELNRESPAHTPPPARYFISPTHKRTEERAPVWGSELTSKRRRTTGGDPAETAARLNVKLRVLVTAWWWDLTAFSTRKLKAATRKLKADEERTNRK